MNGSSFPYLMDLDARPALSKKKLTFEESSRSDSELSHVASHLGPHFELLECTSNLEI